MGKLVVLLIIIGFATILGPQTSVVLVGHSQDVNSNTQFLTYFDTNYGISIKYPANWKIEDEYTNEYLIKKLIELTNESQVTNDYQNNAFRSRVSEIFDKFSIQGASDIASLSPDTQEDLLGEASKLISEQIITPIVVLGPPVEDAPDVLVTVFVRNISSLHEISPKDYVDVNLQHLKDQVGFQMLQQPTDIIINGIPAISLIYSASSSSGATPIGNNLYVIMINDENVFLLTFNASPATYSTYAPIFENMLYSFKVTK